MRAGVKLIIFFRINSLNICIHYGSNKTDKNRGLILFFKKKKKIVTGLYIEIDLLIVTISSNIQK